MRAIGLHLRIADTLTAVARQAIALGLQTFQYFLINQRTKRQIALTDQEVTDFLQLRDQFTTLYVHGAYWINLCGQKSKQATKTLLRELKLAKRLAFTHYVLHPGCAIGWPDRMDGIDCLVRVLNTILKHEHEIKIVLENIPHGGNTIGGDLTDFEQIREKLDHPEKVSFCIDTAHAYAFGYDIVTKQTDFITLLDKTVGIDAIALIHLNDTQETLGLRRDTHGIIGTGNIGSDALRCFVSDERLALIPLLMELPPLADYEYAKVLDMVRHWQTLSIKKEKQYETNSY